MTSKNLVARSARALAALLVAVLVQLPAAHAGEVLKLKGGTVRLPAITASQTSPSTWASPRASVRKARKEATSLFILQFRSTIRLVDRQKVESAGAKVVRYFPEDAYLIRASERVAKLLATTSTQVRSLVPFDPAWKFSTQISPSSVFSANNEVIAHVQLFPGADVKRTFASLKKIDGLKVEGKPSTSFRVQARRPLLDQVAMLDSVEWIQPAPKFEVLAFKPLDEIGEAVATGPGDYSDLVGTESGTQLMGFVNVWSRGLTGRGQTVAMADTGLDSGDITTLHPDFLGRVPQGFVHGLFSRTWADPMGHGTHVAGSVMSSGIKSGGLLKGGAYEASLIPQGLWSPMLGGLSIPKMGDLFTKAYNAGARIHTNSWGSPQNPGAYDSFASQVDEFAVSHPDFLILFAAGNSGVDADRDGRIDPNSVGTPGTAKNIITVGASENLVSNGGIQKPMSELRDGAQNWGVEPLASSKLSDNPQGIAAFSSRGPTADGRTKPEVVAPGTNILSNRSQDPEAQALWGAYNNDYVWSGGTSMATPLAAGAAAVVRQSLIEERKIAKPSSALIKAALMHTANDLFPGQFGEVGQKRGQEILTRRPNNEEGFGRVDVAGATNLGQAVLIDEAKGLATGEAHSYPVKVSATSKITATLVYTDAPGAAGASQALVNDLDLVLVELKTGRETKPSDRINNAELIEVDIPGGEFEVRIKGHSVPQGWAAGKQPYALILSVR